MPLPCDSFPFYQRNTSQLGLGQLRRLRLLYRTRIGRIRATTSSVWPPGTGHPREASNPRLQRSNIRSHRASQPRCPPISRHNRPAKVVSHGFLCLSLLVVHVLVIRSASVACGSANGGAPATLVRDAPITPDKRAPAVVSNTTSRQRAPTTVAERASTTITERVGC